MLSTRQYTIEIDCHIIETATLSYAKTLISCPIETAMSSYAAFMFQSATPVRKGRSWRKQYKDST